MPTKQAAIGDTVHYVSHGTPLRGDGTQAFKPACRAATVTETDPDNPDRIGIAVLNPTGMFFHPLGSGGCTYEDDGTDTSSAGTWHWPDRA